MESLFERLRRRQRRISGRKSTRELRDFGQAQVLFQAESEATLLEQIRQCRWSSIGSGEPASAYLNTHASSSNACITIL